jgi:arsenite methyltransferase
MQPAAEKEAVKNLYATFAETVMARESRPLADSANYVFCRKRYLESELALVPPTAIRLACGAGNPVDFADIRPGGVVVDLGCGGGVDVVLAAHKVAEHGKVLGIDIVPEMVEAARRAVTESGLHQLIFFRMIDIEDIYPLPKNFADVVIANCVINLCPDRPTVYKNIYRVLRPGGLLVLSDFVLAGEIDSHLQKRLRSDPGGSLGRAVATEDHLQLLQKVTFDILRVDHKSLAAQDLETIACYPDRDIHGEPRPDDLLQLHGKVAVVTIMAKRRPLN